MQSSPRSVDFSSIKAILFDIDDTLFPSSEFSRLARHNAIRAMVQAGLPATPARAGRELEKIVKARGSNYGNHFGLLARRFHPHNPQRVVAAGVAAYHNTKSSISPYSQTARLLLALRERGFILAVASEGVALKQWDKLIRLGLDPFFHHVFVTSTNKEGKTPAFYRQIARKLHLHPSQILMMGDNPAKDIMPAAAAGMHTGRLLLGKHARERAKASFSLRSLSPLLWILSKHGRK
ncbi:MAG: HAD hydrolase-like protein [Candidatus Marsarchaeota archaeon]|nr:HAD hydrolase-like protein [Candidatus Marsarchaeota archaeon]